MIHARRSLRLLLVLSAFLAMALPARADDPDPAALVGAWIARDGGTEVRAVLRADGTFTRSMVSPEGRDVAEGRWTLRGSTLAIVPDGGEAIELRAALSAAGRLTLTGGDGSVLVLEKQGAVVPDPRPQPAPGNPLVPAWVRPGARMTYEMMTGTLSVSVNGFVLDENSEWVLEGTDIGVSTHQLGHSSHGLIQVTVVGLDAQVAALAKPFYLYDGADASPILNRFLDVLVPVESGGDFWMHPRLQAQMIAAHPWGPATHVGQIVARSVPWTVGGQTYQATFIAALGDGTRTTLVYDQASGRLLTQRSLSRVPPPLRDLTMTQPDSVSQATFIEYRSARQLSLPWLDEPAPPWSRSVSALSYRGSVSLEGPGMTPTPLATSDDYTLNRRGVGWMSVHDRAMTEGTVVPVEVDLADGVGSLPPLGIPPAVLARLTVGQAIDRDPETGIAMTVSGADAQSVTLRTDGPRRVVLYVYARENGALLRRVSRTSQPATPDMVEIRDVSLTGSR